MAFVDVSWTQAVMPLNVGNNATFGRVSYWDNEWFIPGKGYDGASYKTVLWRSTDTTTWTAQDMTSGVGGVYVPNEVARSGDTIVVSLNNGYVSTSTDNGSSWSAPIQAGNYVSGVVESAVRFSNSRFIFYFFNGSYTSRGVSTDGVNWSYTVSDTARLGIWHQNHGRWYYATTNSGLLRYSNTDNYIGALTEVAKNNYWGPILLSRVTPNLVLSVGYTNSKPGRFTTDMAADYSYLSVTGTGATTNNFIEQSVSTGETFVWHNSYGIYRSTDEFQTTGGWSKLYSNTNSPFGVLSNFSLHEEAGLWVVTNGGRVYCSADQLVISGTIRDHTGTPCARTVRLYNRATGAYMASTTSDASTGIYTFRAGYSINEYQRVAVADDTAEGAVYNDLIDRVLPG